MEAANNPVAALGFAAIGGAAIEPSAALWPLGEARKLVLQRACALINIPPPVPIDPWDDPQTLSGLMDMEPRRLSQRSDRPIIVVSLPKAGTYLVAELLKALGCRWTGMHLADHGYSDYRGADVLEARHHPDRFARRAELIQALMRIRPGEFAVGHLPCRPDVLQATVHFKRLYVTRDLRCALISYMRFMQTTGRYGAEQLAWYSVEDPRRRIVVFLSTTAPHLLNNLYKDMEGWSHVEGITHVRFEDLVSPGWPSRRAVDSVAASLGAENYDARRILQAALAAETITKSGSVTQVGDYWSPQAEKAIIQIGGADLNARLGCLQALPTGAQGVPRRGAPGPFGARKAA